jgi:L-ascorbate metabolism protein UlaG (beta-lactamase superfamily)
MRNPEDGVGKSWLGSESKLMKFYLKPNVILEPLVNQWYAWPHLISPATASLNIVNGHLKMMRSFVSAPDIHAAAVRNPAMRGGPFVDLPKYRVNEVKALAEQTVREQAHLIQLADGVKTLNDILLNEGAGQSLEPLYQKVPECLRGYVELVYDLNKNASMRFIEPLLYKSRYYDPALQSIDLSLANGDERPFVFSTPRLVDRGRLNVKVPFNHEAIDLLARMRHEALDWVSVAEALSLSREEAELFQSFLTEAPPAKPAPYDGDSVRIRYFGHACILIESKELTIMTDPLISYEADSEVPRYTYADVPDVIDYVLITHTHQDHVLLEALLQLRHKIRNIVVPRNTGGALEDPSLKLVLKNIGFKNVIEIDEMESVEIADGAITGLPFFGEHGDLNIRSKIAHLVQLKGKSILCAADSANIEARLYENIHDQVGDIDVLFLGMECEGAPVSWIYGALMTKPLDRKMDRSRRLSGSDSLQALDLVKRFNCKRVYVYAMGQEPWLSFVTSIKYTDESKPIVESNKLLQSCASLGAEAERLFGQKALSL